MGKKTKPTAQKVIQGSFKKHPERRNHNEPVPVASIGNPPGHLSSAEASAWTEIVDNCCVGVFGNSDRLAVERAAILLTSSRDRVEIFTAAQETALYRYLSSFGMTPADRTKISVANGGKSNPFDSL